MNISQAESLHQPNLPLASPVTIPDDVTSEVLSLLDVKSLMRLKCVCKSWNSLISDPIFVKMHLKQSSRNTHLIVKSWKGFSPVLVGFPLRHLQENPSSSSSFNLADYPYYQFKDDVFVGSCNGILCFIKIKYKDYKLCFWNPATRTLSKNLGYFFSFPLCVVFGYDNLTHNYKVVALYRYINGGQAGTEVRVFSLGENVWRTIQSFPGFICLENRRGVDFNRTCVYFSGTVNWLAFPTVLKYPSWKDFVIISLDLGTETYMQFPLPLPHGFDTEQPATTSANVCVLIDRLCFSHDFKRTYFIIWMMTEFGVGESWTQFLKISYQNLQYDIARSRCFSFGLIPICVYENRDILIWTAEAENHTILYNRRDNKVKRAKIGNALSSFIPEDYVKSLVWPFQKTLKKLEILQLFKIGVL